MGTYVVSTPPIITKPCTKEGFRLKENSVFTNEQPSIYM